jgi:hypothetical protein
MYALQLSRRLMTALVVIVVGAPTAFGQITVDGGGSYATIQAAINAASSDDLIEIPNGTYNESLVIPETKQNLTLAGESEAGVIVNLASTSWGVNIQGDGTTLRNLTLNASSVSYGIKAQGSDSYPGTEDRLVGLTIEDVTVQGASVNELDLNGVDNAVIRRVTLNGQNTGGTGTGGTGFAATDSNNLTLDDIDTDGQNLWGGIALFTQGQYHAPGITGVTITNVDGVQEAAPLYQQIKYYESPGPVVQDDPAPYLVTQLDADAFGFTVTNPTFRLQLGLQDSRQFTFYQRTEADAVAFAATLPTPENSEVRERDLTPFDGSTAGSLANNELSPILECVAQNNAPNPYGNFTARFGFLNGKGEAVEVPIGEQNKFTGGGRSGQDLGQPTVFEYPAPNNVPGLPGRTSYRGLFSVDFDGSNLVWNLNGKTATASSSTPKVCPENCSFSDRPAWPNGDIISNGDGTGYFEITAANGFKEIALVLEDSDNIALVELRDEFDDLIADVNGGGTLSGSEGSGYTTLTYTGPEPGPTSVRVVVRQLEPGTSQFMFRVLDRCKYTLQVDPVIDLGATTNVETSTSATDFALSANSPNPFSARTTISFTLETPEHVTLRVYDVLGRSVATLVDARLEAGTHEAVWNGRRNDGSSVASGVYFYRIEAGAFRAARQMTVVK